MSSVEAVAEAAIGELCLCAEDAYDAQGGPGKAPLEVQADARLAPQWTVHGHIVGQDVVFEDQARLGIADEQAWYGWLLEHKVEQANGPGEFVAVIRGTDGFIEWADDAKFAQVPHPRAGWVEAGFWGIYGSLVLCPPGGGHGVPLVSALSAMVGAGSLLVTGHSLGAALANLLSVDAADPNCLGSRVSTRLFASPRAGDAAFAAHSGSLIADRRGYARELDIVPRVPFGFDYAPMPGTVSIPHDAYGVRVRLDSGFHGQHHITSYMAQIDPNSILGLPGQDAAYLACLVLPHAAAAAAA